MKIGELIKCTDEKDLKQTLKDLSLAGFHAVRVDHNTYWIRITGVPETEYLVQACDQNGRAQNAYCSTELEAEEIRVEIHLPNLVNQRRPGTLGFGSATSASSWSLGK